MSDIPTFLEESEEALISAQTQKRGMKEVLKHIANHKPIRIYLTLSPETNNNFISSKSTIYMARQKTGTL
jgi:hypothetical protein